MPFKHVGASAIGVALNAVLAEGRPLEDAARMAGATRQTVANWLADMERCRPAHLSEHLPRLGVDAAPSSPAEPTRASTRPGRAGLSRLWLALLAAVGFRRGEPSDSDAARIAFERLQPRLSELRPAAGVFRSPLNASARAPPRL